MQALKTWGDLYGFTVQTWEHLGGCWVAVAVRPQVSVMLLCIGVMELQRHLPHEDALRMLSRFLTAGMGSHVCYVLHVHVCMSRLWAAAAHGRLFWGTWHRLREVSEVKGCQGGRLSLGCWNAWYLHPCCEIFPPLKVLGSGEEAAGLDTKGASDRVAVVPK